MSEMNTGFKKVLLVVSLVAALALVIFLGYPKKLPGLFQNRDKISYNSVCPNITLPDSFNLCPHAVAVYNHDVSLCEKISIRGREGEPRYDFDVQAKKNCIDTVLNGEVVLRKFDQGKRDRYGDNEANAFALDCELLCKKIKKTFITVGSNNDMPLYRDSITNFVYSDFQKEENSLLINSCSCF